MASAQFADRYQSTLASGYTSGGGSLIVTSATGLPSSGDFYVLAEADGANTEEVLKVTAVSGTTLTVTGAQANTAASDHGSGTVVRGTVWTAGAIAQTKLDIVSSMTVAAFDTETSTGTANPNGRGVVYLSDGIYTCVWNGTAWEYYSGGQLMTRPVSSAFSWVNQGGASVVTSSGGMFLSLPAGTGTSWRMRVKAAPATPYTVTAHIRPMALATGGFGLVFRQSSDGKFAILRIVTTALESVKYTNETTVSAGYGGILTLGALLGLEPHWLRIADNGTSRICSVSSDGINFIPFHTIGRTDFLTANQIGVAATASDATNPVGVMVKSWKES